MFAPSTLYNLALKITTALLFILPQVSVATLVVTVPTRDGLVICADNRRWNKVQGGIDTSVKLFKIGEKAAFAHAGYSAILSRKTYEVVFDVSNAPVEFFRRHSTEQIEDLWDDLQKTMVEAYFKHLEGGGTPFSMEHLLPDGTMYLSMFYYVIKDDIRVKRIQARYSATPQPNIQTQVEDATAVSIHSAYVEGQTEVVAELLKGNDPAFEPPSLTTDPLPCMPCSLPRWTEQVLLVAVVACSHAGVFPVRAAFPISQAGRHPHLHFRGLLKLHTRYGLQGCSPTFRGLYREASPLPVSRLGCSQAIQSYQQLLEWVVNRPLAGALHLRSGPV